LLADDGDPLDIQVVISQRRFPGCVVGAARRISSPLMRFTAR
jgi:inorganic pyrophosphatase